MKENEKKVETRDGKSDNENSRGADTTEIHEDRRNSGHWIRKRLRLS